MNDHVDEEFDVALPQSSSSRKWIGCAGLILVGILGCILLLPAPNCGDGRRSHCANNLKQLGLALHNYHEQYGSLPPAYIADENGKPMHSWRVLLLQMLDEGELYKQYRFDEPWDGPNNSKLHDKMPSVFQCPSDDNVKGTQFTNYVAVVGKNTVWPYEKSIKFDEITDGLPNTIFLVETKNSGIHWMEPRDLEFDKMSFKINDPDKPSLSSKHKGVDDTPSPPQVLLGDGGVSLLIFEIAEKTLKALLTINGGEKVSPYFD